MAYNFFDLGIKGTEIQRRLNLLQYITAENPIAVTNDLNNL